jgi:hypothetical protein
MALGENKFFALAETNQSLSQNFARECMLETKKCKLLLHCNKRDKWQLGPNPMDQTMPQGVLYETCTWIFAIRWLWDKLMGVFWRLSTLLQ